MARQSESDAESDAPSAPGRRIPLRHPEDMRPFISVVGVSFAFFMGHSIILPSLALYAAALAAPVVQIGLIVAGFAIGRMIFNPLAGAMADRLGIRLVAAFGCVVTIVGALGAAMAPTSGFLVATRLVQGAGSAFYLIPAYAYVASIAADDGLGRILSLYQGTLLVGHSFGPVVGGFAAAIWGLRAPNFAFAALVAVGLVLTCVFFPSTAKQFGAVGTRTRRPRRQGAVRQLLLGRAFAVAMLVCLVTFVMRSGVRLTLLPLFAAGALHFDAGQIGILMSIATVCNVAIIPNAGRLMDSIGRRPVVVWSMAATSLVLYGFAVMSTGWLVYVGAGLLGAVTGYAGAPPAAIAADLSDPTNRSSALGLQRMTSDLGTVLGPLAIGWMLGFTGYSGVFLTCALLATATTALSLFMTETLARKRHAKSATAS